MAIGLKKKVYRLDSEKQQFMVVYFLIAGVVEMTQKRCEEAHLAAIASEAIQVSVIAIVLCKSIVASRSL